MNYEKYEKEKGNVGRRSHLTNVRWWYFKCITNICAGRVISQTGSLAVFSSLTTNTASEQAKPILSWMIKASLLRASFPC